jgi:hypothetical protein
MTGRIAVHEFVTLDGEIDDPAWTMEYGLDPEMGGAIARIMGSSEALLMGRNTTSCSPRRGRPASEDDPGRRS